MTKRIVVQVRIPTQEEKDRWVEAAGSENLSVWLRRLANEEVALRRAETEERGARQTERLVAEQKAFPRQIVRDSKCKHVAVGEFCYLCNGKRW